jgi:hypothetical protein
MTRKKPRRMPDELPSREDAVAALSNKQQCEKLFGRLRRDDIIDYFKRSVEMGIADGTKAATIYYDPEDGGEVESVIDEAVAVPIWYLAQAAVLLKSARPGRKSPMSWKEQRIRLAAKRLYHDKTKKLGSADAATYVSDWLGKHGINLSKGSILKGGLSRRTK